MRKLKLFFACLLMAVLSIGQVWGADPSVKSTFSTSSTVTDNKVTENGVTWTLDVTVAAGTPTITTGTASSIQGLKFGSSGSNYYSPIKFSTDYFKDYNVKSVTIYEKNNGSKIGTLTVKQGSITIGTASHSAKTSNWETLTASGTTGAGGTLEVTYEVAQASYFNYIEVVYEEGGTTCTSEITITKADDPANGTFALDNSGTVCIDEGNATVNVTATPADHYHLATVTSTAGTVGTISGNTCEITDIDADTEIGVTFAEDTKYVVTWNVNGNEDTKTNVYAGEKPVFPATPAACDATSTTFYGWATAPWTGKLSDLSEKTVYTSASAMPDVDGVVTYYAVFAKMTGSASVTHTLTISGKTADTNYGSHSETDDKDATWSGEYNYGDATHIGLNKKAANHYLGSPLFSANVTSVKATIKNGASSARSAYLRSDNETAQPSSGDLGSVSVPASSEQELTFTLEETAFKQFYVYVSDPLQFHEFVVTLEGSASYEDYMTTCCTQHAVNIAAGIEHGSVSADPTSACEGATVTLTFTPAGGYHLDSWSLNGTAQNIAVNTFSMPAAAATVSATFAHDDCANLAAPTLDEITKTYNSATIAWNEVTDAEEYAVSVVNHATSESVFAGNVDALSKALADLEPETQYDYSIMAVGDGTIKCADGNGVLAGNFTTEPLPTAHLTLMNLGVEHASSGDYAILTPFNLPTTAAACSKAFVGWDANSECASAPTYAKGAEFTFANTTGVTLYAVYADETPGAATLTKMTSSDALANGDKIVVVAKDTKYGLYQETVATSYVKNWEFSGDAPAVADLSDVKKIWDVAADDTKWQLGDATNGYLYMNPSGNELYVKADQHSAWDVAWNTTNSAFTMRAGSRYLSCRTDLTSDKVNYYRGGGTGTTTGTAFFDIYKYGTSASTYSNYSTTCVAALADPEFTPAGGVYTEAKNIVITAEEGTIYYTLDGTDPTSSSDEYTAPIVLDANGTTTIKAIAISATSQSAIVTATYTINLPLSTMDQIFAAATAAGGTATDVNIAFGNWVVSGVSTNGKNVFVTDGTKGFIIYDGGGEMGFAVGDVLSGTAACKVQLYNGAAELTTLSSTTEGLNVATGGTVTPEVKAISALSGINTGAAVTINSVQFDGEYLSDGANEIKPYNSLFAYEALENGKYYNVTGIYQQFGNTTKEILPRSAADIEEKNLQPSGISYSPAEETIEVGDSWSAPTFNNEHNLTVTFSGNNDAVATVNTTTGEIALAGGTGTAVITASFAGDATYAATNVTYTITVNPASVSENVVILAVYDTKYYAMSTTIPSEAFTAIEVEYDGSQVTVNSEADKTAIQWTKKTSGDNTTFQTKDEDKKYMKGTSSGAAMSLNANVCNWSWDGTNEYYYIGSRSFFYQNGVGFKNYATSNFNKTGYSGKASVIVIDPANIVVSSKVSAELAYDPTSVELTVGDAFIPATLTYAVGFDGLAEVTYESSNETLATVGTDGTVTLASGKTGTATITATFAGNTNYLAGDASYVITVNEVPDVCDGTDDFATTDKTVSPTGYATRTTTDGWVGTNVRFQEIDEKMYWKINGKTTAVGTITSPVLSDGIATLKFRYANTDSENNGVSVKIEIKQGEDVVKEYTLTKANADVTQNTVYTELIENINVAGDFQIVFTNLSPSNSTSNKDRVAIGRLCWSNYSAPEPPTKDLIRDGLSNGKWGTLCPTQDVTDVEGAVFYLLSYLEEKDGLPYNVVFDEITGPNLQAGKPYFFIANAEEIRGNKTGDVATAAGAGVNGFYGYIGTDPMDLSWRADYDVNYDNTFVIYNNSVFRINGDTQLKSERCYININATEPSRTAVPKAYGRRRITMSVAGTNVATGFENLNASEKPVKLMIDGNIYILRGEKLYDATGRLVK